MPLRQREEIQEVLLGQRLSAVGCGITNAPPTLNSESETLNEISIHGARQPNLKNISLAIPRGRFLRNPLQGTISTA